MITHRPVTGPGGDNPISDAQIVELQRALGDNFGDLFRDALRLHGADLKQRRPAARARCAEIYNARHAGKDGR